MKGYTNTVITSITPLATKDTLNIIKDNKEKIINQKTNASTECLLNGLTTTAKKATKINTPILKFVVNIKIGTIICKIKNKSIAIRAPIIKNEEFRNCSLNLSDNTVK
jgi:hypothetical protein